MPDGYARFEKGCVTDNDLYHPGFNNKIHKLILVYSTPAINEQHWYIFYEIKNYYSMLVAILPCYNQYQVP